MAEVCQCDPADCTHAENRMTPLEFAEKIITEAQQAGRSAHATAMSRELARAGARRPQRLESVTA